MEGTPLASFAGETLDKNPVEPVGFHGPGPCPRPPRSTVGLGGQFGGFGLWPSHAAGGVNPGPRGRQQCPGQILKENEIMLFAATWMDLEIVILSEVSQTEKGRYHKRFLICGI